MKTHSTSRNRAFTLLETVIAIGVLAVLLTGFMIVFGPAAAGVRKAISVQEADRLTSTVEQELVTLRDTSYTNGFNKGYDWILNSSKAVSLPALLVYQYRGSLSSYRTDGTPTPVPVIKGNSPGKDYIVVTMLRRKSDTKFISEDLPAVEGGIYLVKCTQLVFSGGQLKTGTPGQIVDPKAATPVAIPLPDNYPEAVVAFRADFYSLPSKDKSYFGSATGFAATYTTPKNPVFSRNLAIRR